MKKLKLKQEPTKKEVVFKYDDWQFTFNYEDDKLTSISCYNYACYSSQRITFKDVDAAYAFADIIKDAYEKQKDLK